MKSLLSSALALATVALLATGCSDNKSTASDASTTTSAATAPAAAMDTTATPAAATKAQVGQYYCPMHPEVVMDRAGDCSQCGMALVKKG